MTMEKEIAEILSRYSCLTALEIKGFIYRRNNIRVTPQSIGSIIRKWERQGKASSSKNCANRTVYWLTVPIEEVIA